MRIFKNPVRLVMVLLAVVFLVTVAYFSLRHQIRKLLSDVLGAASVGVSDHHHADHVHEAPMKAVTIWTDTTEFFMDHAQFVAGEPVELAIHLTNLRDGTPISEGDVTFIASAAGIGQVIARGKKAAQGGIFIAQVTFARATTYQARLRHETRGPDAVEEVRLPPFTVYPSVHDAYHAAPAEQETDAEITFLKDQQWRIQLLTEVVRLQEMVEQLSVPGKVVAPHPSEAVVPPPVPGRVLPPPGGEFPHIDQRVRKDQVLAVIEPTVAGADAVQLLVNQAQLKTLDAELAAKQLDVEARMRSVELEHQLSEQTLRRQKQLSGKGITAEKHLLVAQYERDETEARLQGLRRMLDTYRASREQLRQFSQQPSQASQGAAGEQPEDLQFVLRSPLEGTVVEADATAGEYVAHDHPLFRIIDLSRLYIEAEVSEYDLQRVESSAGASYRLAAYPDRQFSIYPSGGGRLAFIGSVVAPETRTLSVRYEVPNTHGYLRVGMYADVLIETQRRPQVLAVHKQAIVEDSGEAVVYVQTGGESFERRAVQQGIRSGDLVEIRSGLRADDRVVVHGAYRVRLSTLSGAIPEHHHH